MLQGGDDVERDPGDEHAKKRREAWGAVEKARGTTVSIKMKNEHKKGWSAANTYMLDWTVVPNSSSDCFPWLPGAERPGGAGSCFNDD